MPSDSSANRATTPSPAAPPRRAPVDPRGPRFSAAITAVLLLVVIFLSLTGASVAALVLLAAIAALFAWGAFAGVGRHPYGLLFKRFVRPRLAPPAELEDAAPPTFAQGVGLFVTVIGVVLGLFGLAPAVGIAAGFAFIAAFLNSVFDYCLGCQLYLLLVRARILSRSPAAA
ncbi:MULTISPECIES: DUF4395 domain-containing protein [unclassified Cryobacterium]|uniref:DUF4395 domain-containing protein n=1 Tax=unclassified Cryobacterium TaxID=2649013 RepID=UPI00106D9803|nr:MULTISPECIES: DUF4395 domain-containing protein [unclassified Cryobacterium]MDY7527169.1 DUF4395 domain-containing protein [Cryobacterium sp. 10C2]MDY7557040.1 DUF4395 domain-containing protein [Cryobacterium sp. 10C3]MEB0002066.1 DUF4395 domain-containing protein [Cryobacterium sp. RTC2.1]MEB0200335.1 DUF4395 domain-containing protein [Cryobacterium sp. 5I3]MEB0286612.1 DUF4395 domain-containing protein [Cryobacterium sp. 10S3]